MRNIRDITLAHNGHSRTIREWAEIFNVEYAVVRMRYSRGERNFNKLFCSARGYMTPKPDTNLVRKNIRQRIETLEQRVEALKRVVLQLAERVENDQK